MNESALLEIDGFEYASPRCDVYNVHSRKRLSLTAKCVGHIYAALHIVLLGTIAMLIMN